ncbi:MAG TPA: PIG-L family deacetylase [Ktedonobacterales bacterium]
MRRRQSASLQPMRLLGVFAHPDDEVFCAGGTLAQWASAGGETMIVSATRGEVGQIHDVRASTRSTLGAVRERELRSACARLGVHHVECLDYRDGTLADVGLAEVAARVAGYIRDFRSDVVVTFGPDGGYGHPDHIAIGAATTEACRLVARADGWSPRLCYSAFPQRQESLCLELARWLTTHTAPFHGSPDFVRAFSLLADELSTMGFTDDAVAVRWFPADFAIAERGERATSLYLIVSGHVRIIGEDAHGARPMSECLGPGQFFGEKALALRGQHDATTVAEDTVTCLVLSSEAVTAFAGRGKNARRGDTRAALADDLATDRDDVVRIDVACHLAEKSVALAEHRTQFAIGPELLALAPVWRFLDQEFFLPVALDAAGTARPAGDAERVFWPLGCPALAMPA